MTARKAPSKQARSKDMQAFARICKRLGLALIFIKAPRDQHVTSINFKTGKCREMVVVKLAVPADSQLGRSINCVYAQFDSTRQKAKRKREPRKS